MKSLDGDTSSESEEAAESVISRHRLEPSWGRLPPTVPPGAPPNAWGWNAASVSVLTLNCLFILM